MTKQENITTQHFYFHHNGLLGISCWKNLPWCISVDIWYKVIAWNPSRDLCLCPLFLKTIFQYIWPSSSRKDYLGNSLSQHLHWNLTLCWGKTCENLVSRRNNSCHSVPPGSLLRQPRKISPPEPRVAGRPLFCWTEFVLRQRKLHKFEEKIIF